MLAYVTREHFALEPQLPPDPSLVRVRMCGNWDTVSWCSLGLGLHVLYVAAYIGLGTLYPVAA